MHFLLLGATGRTGQYVVSELLAQGHTAVALIRPSSRLTPRPGLTIVTGSPLEKSDIQKTITAAPNLKPEAAIYTLNSGRKNDGIFAPQLNPPRFLADTCAAACEVLEQANIRRIVVMSSVGVGDSWNNLPWLNKGFMALTNVKFALADHNDVDKEIRTTKMDWTLVRAPRLNYDVDTNTSVDVKKEVQTLDSKGTGMKLSDVVGIDNAARFLIKCAVEKLYIKEAVVIRE
jgi:putative NADH-flavin reductase